MTSPNHLTSASLPPNALSPNSEISESSAWGRLRRHVVQHDWGTIRNALHVAKHEHMSGLDVLVSRFLLHVVSRSLILHRPAKLCVKLVITCLELGRQFKPLQHRKGLNMMASYFLKTMAVRLI